MSLLNLLPIFAVAAVMWLLLIRPARKRQQEQAKLVAALAPGQRIMTTSGLLGTVVRVGEAVAVEVAEGVVVEFVPPAIARVLPDRQPSDVAPVGGEAEVPVVELRDEAPGVESDPALRTITE
jgi:preprotein translocase subunit YajC